MPPNLNSNPAKVQLPGRTVTNFNIAFGSGSMLVTEERMRQFKEAFENRIAYEQIRIYTYVWTVDNDRADELLWRRGDHSGSDMQPSAHFFATWSLQIVHTSLISGKGLGWLDILPMRGLQMALSRASGAHVLQVRCAPSDAKSPFSPPPELKFDLS